MKLKDALANYDYFTSKISEISRQLGFAGIALIWLFKNEGKGVPEGLRWPTALIVLALALDFFHYFYASAAWGIFHRFKESASDVTADTEFLAPLWLNFPHLIAFWLKLGATAAAYVWLASFFIREWKLWPL